MNSVMKKLKRLLREAPFISRISGGALALLSISVLLFSATAANAACGLRGTGSKSPIRLPMLAQAGNDLQEDFGRDLEDAVSLGYDIKIVCAYWTGAGDVDGAADAHGAGEANDGLVGR